MIRSEELYLEGELAIKNGNYGEAKSCFENALMDDPELAAAHNSLGWIYKSQFEDYEKAINHFKAAINFSPEYPHPYNHLADIYIDNDDWVNAKTILATASKIATVSKARIFYNYGRIDELHGNFKEAIENYKQALLRCLNNESVEDYKKDIERCKYKLELKR